MTLEEAKTELPWLEFTRNRFMYDLRCNICHGLENFSALMLEQSFGGDVMQVKPVRFHVVCGQQAAVKEAQKIATRIERSAVNVTPVRSISLTDE